MVVCHRCDVPACVNPDHLWVGTQAENLQDCRNKGRAKVGEACSASKLTETQVFEIVEKLEGGASTRQICAEYNISSGHVSQIYHGNKWRHVNRTPSSHERKPYKLSEFDRIEIHWLLTMGATATAVARAYGVSDPSIHYVRKQYEKTLGDIE